MNNFILDCERMKYADTGIYHYCLNLGRHLMNIIDANSESLTFYAPDKGKAALGSSNEFINQHPLHKFFMPSLSKYDLWHATYQNRSPPTGLSVWRPDSYRDSLPKG